MTARLLGILLLAALARAESGNAALLAQHGIKADAVQIGKFLRSLYPDEETRKRVQQLVAGLGHPDEAVRRLSTQFLTDLRAAPIAALEVARNHNDPEVRRRARRLLETAQRYVQPDLVYAAFATIAAKRLKGLVEPVLFTAGLRPEEFIHDAAVHALSATATKEDLPTLRRAFSSPLQAKRVAAILAAGVVLGDRAVAELGPLMRDGSEATRYAAARALANRGVRASLPVLGELLSSDHGSTRLRAVQTLRLVRGEPFGYSAHLGAAARRNAERAWLDWISSAGPKASWPTPIRARPLFRGRTLISLYSDGKIIEIDASGRQVWEQKIRQPWACVGLPNGHRLVSMLVEKSVVEYDAGGNEVWRTKKLPGGSDSGRTKQRR